MKARGERGSVLVFVGLALFLLSAFIGLATDVGILTFVHNQGQAAVDAAALAGASGIPEYHDTGSNSVSLARIAALDGANDVRGASPDLGSGGDDTTIEYLVYDQEEDEFTCTSGCDPDEVNAVRVTKAGYVAPMFFSWARNAFAATTATTTTVNVSATAYLSCPGDIDTGEGDLGPIALRECKIGFPDACDASSIHQSSTSDDNSAFTTFNLTGSSVCKDIAEGKLPTGLQPTVEIGDEINLVGSGSATSCLKAFDDRYASCTKAKCMADPPDEFCTITLPVIDCAGSESKGIVVGFARTCIENVESPSPKLIEGRVQCGDQVPGGPGGECFGTLSKRAILVR